MVVVTSTYRLAPEHRFPAAFEDSLTAARWVLARLDELGGKERPAVIGGDSAGGNLTASVCLSLRDDPQASRAFDLQWLLYPSVDMRPASFDYASRKANADPSLRTEVLHVCVGDYLGTADPSDPRASPSAAPSLGGLPRALVVVLTVDPLRDEAVAYAEALRGAGVEAELMEFSNLTHGFVHFSGIIPAAAVALGEVEGQLKKMLSLAD
jgi:acetyl esterase